MKKNLLFLLLITGFTFSYAQKASPEKKGAKADAGSVITTAPQQTNQEKKDENNPNAPKLIFPEETYNFGEVAEGPQVTHEFKFTNTGKEPLILSNVRASCGCTTPSWPKEPILPGKEAIILVTYNTQGRPGQFNKSITITSNADTPNKVIYIKGSVVKVDPAKYEPLEQPTMLAPK